MERTDALTKEKLAELTRNERAILEFSAGWCPDCRFLDPITSEIEEDSADSKFSQISRDSSVEVVKDLSTLGVPNFVAYQGGQEVGRLANKGHRTKNQIESFLRSLD